MKYLLLLCCFALSGAFTPNRDHHKVKFPKAYVFIPSGKYVTKDKTVSVNGFYMQAWEVTNLEYREFLADLKANGMTEEYEKAQVHPEAWKIPGTYMDPMAEHYFQHPAYENYPVVNISHEAAQLYCQWLTKKLQAFQPEMLLDVRLPSEVEWMYAAQAGHAGLPYPHGYYLRNAKGEFLYNFRRFGDESVHRNKETGELEVRQDLELPGGAFFGPSPGKSYAPNDFGLYNMSGNVAEMLAGAGQTKGGCFNSTGYDIRIDAPDEFAGTTAPSPFIGFRPVFTLLRKTN